MGGRHKHTPHTFEELRGERVSAVRRVLVYTLVLNIAVALAKMIYGYSSGSVGMISDGFHSFFDGFSNIVGLVGIWVAAHPPDEKHPYGHKKYETFFTIIIAFAIFVTCFQILKRAYYSFSDGHRAAAGDMGFAVMLLTISVNIFVMLYEMKKGRELKSEFLIADALHTKSDILASLAVIAGLVFVRLGYPMADTVAGLFITVFIGRIGYRILKSASDVLVDTICINTNAVEAAVTGVEGVRGCHGIRTRGTEMETYLDLHILVDPRMSIEDGHDIADAVEEKIKQEFPFVVDIVVHVEPDRRHRIPFRGR
ncbi:MAG: cation diffusion facilitator family transporter [Thermodesulfovibrionales bacterium]|nr:cation diffusion facilitator family transporter [Thermodesulfovibrionales bacterium]